MTNVMSIVAGLVLIVANTPALAQKPVTSGYVLRGVTVPGAGVAGSKVPGKTCSFSDEPVDQTGRMTGASVQAGANKSVAQLKLNLPSRFNAYCVVEVSRLGAARLITASIPGNPDHADLSAMKPKDAQGRFGGAIWK